MRNGPRAKSRHPDEAGLGSGVTAQECPLSNSDRDQIEELMIRYGRAIDARDFEALGRCFTPEAVVRFAVFAGELKGNAELEAFIRRAVTPLDGTHHMFMNFIVEVDGAAGRFTCSVHAQHFRNGDIYSVGGNYVNEAVRTDEGWKMTRLDFAPLWTNGKRDLVPHEDEASAA